MFEFRLRILDVRESDIGPNAFLGIVEGFPQIMTHSTSVEQAEIDLTNELIEHLRRLMNHEATRLELDNFPTARIVRLYLGPARDDRQLEGVATVRVDLVDDACLLEFSYHS